MEEVSVCVVCVCVCVCVCSCAYFLCLDVFIVHRFLALCLGVVMSRFVPLPGRAFSPNQNWLPHPCLLGGPQVGGIAISPLHSRGSPTKGTKSELVALPLSSWGAKSGRNCYTTPTFSGPQQRGQNQNWLPHPCLLGGPQVGGIAMSPLHSRGSPTKGTKSKLGISPMPSRGRTSGWNCCVSLAFSGVPNIPFLDYRQRLG